MLLEADNGCKQNFRHDGPRSRQRIRLVHLRTMCFVPEHRALDVEQMLAEGTVLRARRILDQGSDELVGVVHRKGARVLADRQFGKFDDLAYGLDGVSAPARAAGRILGLSDTMTYLQQILANCTH